MPEVKHEKSCRLGQAFERLEELDKGGVGEMASWATVCQEYDGDLTGTSIIYSSCSCGSSGVAMKSLSEEELLAIRSAPSPGDYITSAGVDLISELVYVTTINKEIKIPFGWFNPHSKPSVYPDFSDVEVIDYGQTLRLGNYEVAADVLLKYS